MHNDTLIAVDVAKSVFEIAVSELPGKVTQRCRLPRSIARRVTGAFVEPEVTKPRR